MENERRRLTASERRNAECLAQSRQPLPARDLAIIGIVCGLGHLLLPPVVWIPLAIVSIVIDVRRRRHERPAAEDATEAGAAK